MYPKKQCFFNYYKDVRTWLIGDMGVSENFISNSFDGYLGDISVVAGGDLFPIDIDNLPNNFLDEYKEDVLMIMKALFDINGGEKEIIFLVCEDR